MREVYTPPELHGSLSTRHSRLELVIDDSFPHIYEVEGTKPQCKSCNNGSQEVLYNLRSKGISFNELLYLREEKGQSERSGEDHEGL